MRSMTIHAAFAALTCSAAAAAQAPTPREQPPEIVVTGTGELRVKPDRASLEVEVDTRAKAAADAAADNARGLRAVLDTLRTRGFGTGEVSTVGYVIQPDWRLESGSREPKQVGYVARNGVRARLRDLERLGATIDAVLAAGANRVSSLRFTASNEAELQLAALDSAVARARQRAAITARGAGGALGPLIKLTTERFEPSPILRGAELQAVRVETYEPRVATPITPGDLVISATVLGRWQFLPTGK
jgi:uncharacterized protein YggE